MSASAPIRAEQAYRIEVVDKFDEPGFSALSESIFRDASRRELALFQAERKGRQRLRELSASTMLRLGAFDSERLVGWTYGWFEREGTYYMANSAVLPGHRRRGVYSALVQRCIDEASKGGAFAIRSRHVASNSAVLIAKLKLGFVITGSEFSEEFGLLVRLTYFANDERKRLFFERAGPIGGFSASEANGDG